ncbi:hypothetical protein, conserved [Eimeria necatrix]|uniref:Uncharacterized protein n=1 Tax=Eimeria necatrix TaxID=51315 RepID=U6MTI0_9EIME|nr:hypothetical protein, conserved [Eimeria necatrix]CDJ65764.1 hypothetical protein, conserved [Eimeria necatrix]
MKFESFLEVFTDVFFCHNLAPEHRYPQQQLLGPHEEASPVDAAASESQTAAASHAAGDPSAEAAKADMPAMTPQQSPRQCNTDKNSSSNSNGREFRDTIRRPSTGGSCQTWGIQLLGAACATPAAGGSSGIGPFGSSRAAAATISGTLVAAAAASGSIAQVTSRPPAAAESFSAAAGTAAARTTVGTPRGSMATLRGLMYTAVSRPSAFVRYEPGGDGFDTAWVNAPMFLISVAPPDAAAAAGAAAGGNYDDDKRQQQQQETGSRQEPPRPQQPQEQQPQLDMLISITQNSNLDVAPISMAVFKARDHRRIWSYSDSKLLGISQAVLEGERPACEQPWKGGGCCLASCLPGVLVGAPEAKGPWRNSCLRLGFFNKGGPRKTPIKNTRRLLVVCYQNVASDSPNLRPNDFIFRTFSSKPVRQEPALHPLTTIATCASSGSLRRSITSFRVSGHAALLVGCDHLIAASHSAESREAAESQPLRGSKPLEPPVYGLVAVGLVAALLRDGKDANDVEKILSSSARQPTESNWLGTKPPEPPPKLLRKLTVEPDEWFVEVFGEDKCSVKLTVLRGAGPLIISPCLETADSMGAFVLHIFSDLPLEKAEALEANNHLTLVGRWDPETAGGSHNFPAKLESPHREPTPRSESGAAQSYQLVTKRSLKGWAANPLYLVEVKKTVQVELTLARHEDCWTKQKEQDVAGCMMCLYIFRGRNVCAEDLVQQSDFVVSGL